MPDPIVPPRCQAVTVAGAPCKHVTNLRDGYCVFHDPERRETLLAMRQRGATTATAKRQENRKVRAALISETAGPRPAVGHSLESVSEFVRWLLEAGVRRELTQGELTALTSGARVLDSLYSKVELERKVRKLTADLAKALAPDGRQHGA